MIFCDLLYLATVSTYE